MFIMGGGGGAVLVLLLEVFLIIAGCICAGKELDFCMKRGGGGMKGIWFIGK